MHTSSTYHQMYSISLYMHYYTYSLICMHWYTCTITHALRTSSLMCPAWTAAHIHYVPIMCPPNASLLGETSAHCTYWSHHHYSIRYCFGFFSWIFTLPLLATLLYETMAFTHAWEELPQHAWQRKSDTLAHLSPENHRPAVQLTLPGCCSLARACMTTSAICLHMHPGKSLLKIWQTSLPFQPGGMT